MREIIDPKKYFMAIVAGILILGIAVGAFVWSFLTGDSIEKAEDKLEIESNLILDPINIGVPNGPPSVPFPDKEP